MRTTTRSGVRPLGAADVAEFLALTDRNPTVNVFAAHRARTTRLEPRLLGGEVWGQFVDGDLVAGCHVGANLVPIEAGEDDIEAFGERLLRRGRTVSTIVGPQPAVRGLWDVLGDSWGPPRESRWEQPHLVADGQPLIEPDPLVRASRPEDFGALYPACVAMYTEELGVSPELGGGAEGYRARVRQLVQLGWSFARYERGRVVFKAEVAFATPTNAQVQGVWVNPDRRGEGLAAAGMAAVVEQVRRTVAPSVSLYVNDWNQPARRAYAKVGFRQTDTFSTLMY
ncbi:GNAT family N-acetyltransferase [Nocardioides islandensis]|uniref:GNAT family N-acetyltransferase n=1 Tax=Nocardioides islandensis TaxID=433663 RepID=A0A930VJN7_9ACTN|nr:GNAT family N-acetyltransferase [Nocardioides islandensis]MBF4765980.1 GNAT family N-acetyltransferase [Nocardioides islandensis]